ncbi:MAG: EAL domain-containing protein [Candidatus Baltobacteraceae bacterium]|jgi:EAL domain-containing protein (putative c-di-GMP-specific phosphodiesterase class I)
MLILYQPIVDIRSRDVVKVEALCRLGTPANPQNPAEFIPYAEENGLIRGLTDRVLQHALDDWKTLGRLAPPGLSLNLSLKNLEEPDLPERVAAALKRAGFTPSLLWFEIGEDVQSWDDSMLEPMKRLAALGVRFSIDNFGPGLSQVSFSELQRLPGVSELKIDARYVRDMDLDAAHRTRVSSVLQLARGLGMRVVAKGVERAEAARLLEKMGCSFAQGYYYGEPCEPAQLRELIARPPTPETGEAPRESLRSP